jgi:hypothetical protein
VASFVGAGQVVSLVRRNVASGTAVEALTTDAQGNSIATGLEMGSRGLGGVEMLGRPLVVIGYLFLIAAFIGYLVLIITKLIDVLPEGIVGLLAIAGFGLLLTKVTKDRLTNKEDNYYSKNVKT